MLEQKVISYNFTHDSGYRKVTMGMGIDISAMRNKKVTEVNEYGRAVNTFTVTQIFGWTSYRNLEEVKEATMRKLKEEFPNHKFELFLTRQMSPIVDRNWL